MNIELTMLYFIYLDSCPLILPPSPSPLPFLEPLLAVKNRRNCPSRVVQVLLLQLVSKWFSYSSSLFGLLKYLPRTRTRPTKTKTTRTRTTFKLIDRNAHGENATHNWIINNTAHPPNQAETPNVVWHNNKHCAMYCTVQYTQHNMHFIYRIPLSVQYQNVLVENGTFDIYRTIFTYIVLCCVTQLAACTATPQGFFLACSVGKKLRR